MNVHPLNVEAPSSPWPDSTRLARKPAEESYCVLLIDDDDDQLNYFSALLEREGFIVEVAHTPEEGLEAMQHRYYDVVVTDLRMPKSDGFDLIERIREIPTVPRSSRPVPIILLTAATAPHLESSALGIGADMFCEKRKAKDLLASQIRFLLKN